MPWSRSSAAHRCSDQCRSSHSPPPGRGHLFGRPADETGQRGERGPVPGRRPLERLEQSQPLLAPARWRRPSRSRRSPPARPPPAARRAPSPHGCWSAPARRCGRDAASCARASAPSRRRVTISGACRQAAATTSAARSAGDEGPWRPRTLGCCLRAGERDEAVVGMQRCGPAAASARPRRPAAVAGWPRRR